MTKVGTKMHQPPTMLEWDTKFWGFPIARINTDTLTDAMAGEADDWCKRSGVRCLYFLASHSCAETLAIAQRQQFDFVDVRIELSHTLTKLSPPHPVEDSFFIRTARTDDLANLQDIAAVSHHDTRFFKDRRFDRQLASQLYRDWITRDFAQHVVLVCGVRYPRERPCGYISCEHNERTNEGRIGLLAVASDFNGLGLGTALVTAALQWFAERNLRTIRVVTQATNVTALRLYERCGFLSTDAGIWFHKWF